jgi:predicted RNA-binding Zn-ribbon protein involved in translation (DUF1610 family)
MPIDPHELEAMVGRPWTHRTPPMCPECGYNLTGLTSARCPECGTHISRREVERLAQEIDAQAVWLRGINDVPRVGLAVALGCGLLLAAAKSMGMPGIGRMLALIGGFAAFAMGLSVLRAIRASEEVLEKLTDKPNYPLGLGAAALGALLVALSLIL